MDTTPAPTLIPVDPGRLHLARTLLLVQAGVIATSVVESAVVGAASPNLASLALLNVAALAVTLWLRHGIGRGWDRARRWLRRIELAWIVLAVVDLVLSIWLARRIELVPIVTRVLLPWAIRRLTKEPLHQAAPRRLPPPGVRVPEVVA